MTTIKNAMTAAAGVVAFVAMTGVSDSSASTLSFIETIPGNDCAGVLGRPFSECKYPLFDPENPDAFRSPIVAKIAFDEDKDNVDDDGNYETTTQLNTDVFAGVTSDMFSASVNESDDHVVDFSWNTLSGLDFININYVVVKWGREFGVWAVDPGTFSFSGSLNTKDAGCLDGCGVSHISFYDSMGVIPLPAAGWLLLSGLRALGVLGHRRRKPAA